MAAPYGLYYSVANDHTLNLPFPITLAGVVAEITRREVDDQDGLEPGVKTTVTMDYQFGFLRGTFQLEIEIIAVGNDGSLLVEAGDLTGSFVSQLIDLLPGDGETLVLTNTAGLTGSNLDELGVFDLEDPFIPSGQEFSYSENQSEGFVLGTVAASDNADVSGFRILSGNDDGFFQINSDGQISLTPAGVATAAASNDFETGPNDFSLTVEATDAAGNTGTGIVTISVTDIFEAESITGTNRCDILFGSCASETIEGLRGNDLIFGRKGDDVILGGSGCDFIMGGHGADDITGGTGWDAVIGGQGEDRFILTEGLGWDRVLDFCPGKDKFGLTDNLTFEDLSFSGYRILAGSDLLAVVRGIQTSYLSEDDFQIM